MNLRKCRAYPDRSRGTLVHFLAEVCPRSRPFRKDSAEAARRKKRRQIEA